MLVLCIVSADQTFDHCEPWCLLTYFALSKYLVQLVALDFPASHTRLLAHTVSLSWMSRPALSVTGDAVQAWQCQDVCCADIVPTFLDCFFKHSVVPFEPTFSQISDFCCGPEQQPFRKCCQRHHQKRFSERNALLHSWGNACLTNFNGSKRVFA